MEPVNPLAEQYAARFTSGDDELIAGLLHHTMSQHPHAHMLSGTVQGRVLEYLSRMIRPRYILEIGTFTGYSALQLVKGLLSDGELHTIELREEDALTAKAYFKRSQNANQLHLHIGNARELIPQINREWDLVFIDADKTSYIEHYELVLPRLKTNGWIIADNVLFHGQVLEPEVKGKNAKAIDAFNRHVAADDRTEQVMLTIRDGLLLIRKK